MAQVPEFGTDVGSLKSVAVALQRKVSAPASLLRVNKICLIALFGDETATSWMAPETAPESATTPVALNVPTPVPRNGGDVGGGVIAAQMMLMFSGVGGCAH